MAEKIEFSDFDVSRPYPTLIEIIKAKVAKDQSLVMELANEIKDPNSRFDNFSVIQYVFENNQQLLIKQGFTFPSSVRSSNLSIKQYFDKGDSRTKILADNQIQRFHYWAGILKIDDVIIEASKYGTPFKLEDFCKNNRFIFYSYVAIILADPNTSKVPARLAFLSLPEVLATPIPQSQWKLAELILAGKIDPTKGNNSIENLANKITKANIKTAIKLLKNAQAGFEALDELEKAELARMKLESITQGSSQTCRIS